MAYGHGASLQKTLLEKKLYVVCILLAVIEYEYKKNKNTKKTSKMNAK